MRELRIFWDRSWAASVRSPSEFESVRLRLRPRPNITPGQFENGLHSTFSRSPVSLCSSIAPPSRIVLGIVPPSAARFGFGRAHQFARTSVSRSSLYPLASLQFALVATEEQCRHGCSDCRCTFFANVRDTHVLGVNRFRLSGTTPWLVPSPIGIPGSTSRKSSRDTFVE